MHILSLALHYSTYCVKWAYPGHEIIALQVFATFLLLSFLHRDHSMYIQGEIQIILLMNIRHIHTLKLQTTQTPKHAILHSVNTQTDNQSEMLVCNDLIQWD